MDCADGSYGQLMDHFGDKTLVDDHLIKTLVVFITHIHGDHQLGILRIMQERDKLIDDKSEILYVVAPAPMVKWLKVFVNDSLSRPNKVVIVPSHSLNPEQAYFY